VPEPLPEFAFFDRTGRAVSASADSAIAFQTSVRAVWHDLSLRPLPDQINLTTAQVIRYLTGHGFTAMAGKSVADDAGRPLLRYEFNAERIGPNGTLATTMTDSTVEPTVFLEHPSCPEVVATLGSGQ
jgi:hypothetical protein